MIEEVERLVSVSSNKKESEKGTRQEKQARAREKGVK